MFSEKDAQTVARFLTNEQKIDMRRLSREGRYLAKLWVLQPNKKRLEVRRFNFPHIEIPALILWCIVKPMIPADGIGVRITKEKRWQAIDIEPEGSRRDDGKAWQRIFDVLRVLADEGFITFYASGSVWRIEHRVKSDSNV